MNVKQMTPVPEPASWTCNSVAYYLHTFSHEKVQQHKHNITCTVFFINNNYCCLLQMAKYYAAKQQLRSSRLSPPNAKRARFSVELQQIDDGDDAAANNE